MQDWFAAFLRFSASPSAAERIARLNYEIDIRAILPTIQASTLVLQRARDRWAKVEEAEFLAKRIPHAMLRILPGDDHIPWYGNQEQLIGEIEEFLTGERRTTATGRSLLTVLITDIVDSTAAVSAMGDERWRNVLDHLDGTVSRRVAAHGGRKIKHTGDGYLLTFTGPTPALECARTLTHDTEALGLHLRTGIHTGECERRGDDLSGLALHLAARIMAKAGRNEILVSRTVKDLAVGSGLTFASVGAFEFKGIPESWDVFRLTD